MGAADAGSDRQRHWWSRRTHRRVRGADFVDDPAGWAALGELVGLDSAGGQRAPLSAFIAEPDRWRDGWVRCRPVIRRSGCRSLQLDDLTAEVQAVIDRYEQTAVRPGDDDEIVVVYFGAVPVDDPS